MEPVDDPRLYSHRYQVTHLIARGGMAMVYRAQDTLLNRAVALKILYPELSQDHLFVERFRREAQAAANLSHPNIVPVFDWGEDDGAYFIVMELVEGTSLAELLRSSSTLTPARCAQIVAQVASALGYAHRSGVVHRDVKPGNILLTRDGQVKVTDFGIAQAVSSEDQFAEAGSVMGTATYFSPEQAEGASVDGRSDVYSLGVVLYEMLVGRPPFVGDSPVEVSSQHVHGTVPSPSTYSSTVPYDLEAIVMESLAKSPELRYQTADEMRADLLRFAEGHPVQAAQRAGAFFGADATRSVATVSAGERTQSVAAVSAGERTRSVPVMTGPRTDIPRRRSNYTTPIIVLLILLLGAGAAYAYVAYHKSSVTRMPDLIGESASSASAQLRSDGFVPNTVYVHSRQSKNTVVKTDPKANAHLSKGQSIQLNVSLGKAPTSPVTIPSLTGQPLASAESTLSSDKLGVKVSQTPNGPSGASPNTVLAQSPAAGTKSRTGTTVILTVLAPNAKYPIDNVDGDTTVAAASTLTSQSLVVSSSERRMCSNTVASGLVVATIPVAGTLVTSGDVVTLVVSAGYCQVVVPNVVGDTSSAATSKLQSQGLGASYSPNSTAICTPGSQPTVATQSDQPGSSVTYGSTVDLTLCQSTVTTTQPPGTGPGQSQG
ncbi:MAG: Stk1 family PASTA domain-containing Ser/Thr kinase [Acidimicrobiales bacterium]